MLSPPYQINDIELLLELGDSAQKTLLIILDQFNGALAGTIDRSGMNNAEKQRTKRGIAELRQKGLLIKKDGERSFFSLNPTFIQAKLTQTREDRYFRSGDFKEDCKTLLHIRSRAPFF